MKSDTTLGGKAHSVVLIVEVEVQASDPAAPFDEREEAVSVQKVVAEQQRTSLIGAVIEFEQELAFHQEVDVSRVPLVGAQLIGDARSQTRSQFEEVHVAAVSVPRETQRETGAHPQGEPVEVIVFTLKDTKTKRSEIYGVNVKQIQEIRNVEKITRLPKSPEFVKGIMNLRGQIITIIDVKQKLDFDTSDMENENPSILISKINDQTLGFLIDDVDDVVRIDGKDIDRNTLENSDSASYLQGFVKTKDRIIILLDLEELILNTKINSEDVK